MISVHGPSGCSTERPPMYECTLAKILLAMSTVNGTLPAHCNLLHYHSIFGAAFYIWCCLNIGLGAAIADPVHIWCRRLCCHQHSGIHSLKQVSFHVMSNPRPCLWTTMFPESSSSAEKGYTLPLIQHLILGAFNTWVLYEIGTDCRT